MLSDGAERSGSQVSGWYARGYFARLRRHPRAHRINRGAPVQILGAAAGDGGEVEVFEPLGDGSDIPVGNRTMIDVQHRRDVRGGAGQEDLVGEVQLVAGDGALNGADAELVTSQPDDGVARDAHEDVLGRIG